MEHVTDITVPVNGKDCTYRVLFHDETYTFEAQDAGAAVPSFNVRRDHNEWIPETGNNEAVVKQAIQKLDAFLLSQH